MSTTVLAAALMGVVKGVARRHMMGPDTSLTHDDVVYTSTLVPLREELLFRAGPIGAARMNGGTLPSGLTAIPFALAHFDPRASWKWNAYRMLDTGVGGLLYEHAYRSGGLTSAVVAHALHNLMASLSSGRV